MTVRRVVAAGTGTFNQKASIKELGYRWEPLSKRWLKDVPEAEVEALVEQTSALPGVTGELTLELIPGGLRNEVSPWYLEPARSGRAACRACKGKLAKGELRFGVGDTSNYSERLSYAWFHLACAATQYPVQLLEVLGQFTDEVPDRAELEAAARGGSAKGAPRPTGAGGYPSAERAKSSRSKCLKCGEKIEKGTFRVIVLREVDGVGEKPGYLHPACTVAHTGQDVTDALRANAGLTPAELAELLGTLG